MRRLTKAAIGKSGVLNGNRCEQTWGGVKRVFLSVYPSKSRAVAVGRRPLSPHLKMDEVDSRVV